MGGEIKMQKTILAVSIREIDTRYGLKKQWSVLVRDDEGSEKWMGTFDSAVGGQVECVTKGDIADIEWEKKGDFLNLKSVKKLEKQEAPPIPDDAEGEIGPEDDPRGRWYFCPRKNRLISRQSSLERAIQLAAMTTPPPTFEEILEAAERFYEWVNK